MKVANYFLLLVFCSLLLGQPLGAHFSAIGAGETLVPLRVGILAFRSLPETLERWQPLANYLSHALAGRSIHLVVANYPDLEQIISRKELDFVLTNPSHYIELRSRNVLSGALATMMVKEQGHVVTGFGGVVVAPAERDDIATLKDIAGKKIAVVSASSLGGYRAQAMALREEGVRLPEDGQLLFTGMPHDNAVQAVMTGDADVGFVRTGVAEAMIEEGLLDPTRIKILGERAVPGFPFALSTRLYPEWPFVALAQADAEAARQVAAALYLFTPDAATVEDMGVVGFGIPADYNSVEELARTLRLPPYDSIPVFEIDDVWNRYRWLIVAGAVALVMMVGLLTLTILINRRLYVAKQLLDIERTRLAGIIAGTDVGTWEWNVQTGEVIFNERWVDIIGYTLAELEPVSGAVWRDYTHPEDLKKSEELLNKNLSGELDYYECEYRMRHKNGDWVWVLDRGKVISRTSGGKPLMMMGTHLDITRRKQSEETLRRSEEHNRALLQALPDLMILLSNDGILLDWHASDPSRLLLPPAEFINHHLRDVVPPEVAAEAMQCIIRARQDNSVEKHEYALEIQGSEHYFESRTAVCGDNTCLAIIRDITQRKSAELALQKKTAEMEEFVYIVSHDLKSPLVTMSAFLAELRKDLQADNHARVNNDINFLQSATAKMNQLLEALLEYSRVGSISQQKIRLGFGALVATCVAALAGPLRNRQVEVVTRSVQLDLHGDQLHLEQIWQNLIENAIKYMGEQPQPHIEVGAQHEAGETRFYVRDNGMGIAPEHQLRIFVMFAQLQPGQPGIGLGLALVKKVVESYKGRIWVESAGKGQGSCFWFTLPQALSAQTLSAPGQGEGAV